MDKPIFTKNGPEPSSGIPKKTGLPITVPDSPYLGTYVLVGPTKAPGKGTGLGLSVCYRIIEGLGGTIRIESNPGVGTAFILELPRPPGPRSADVGDV